MTTATILRPDKTALLVPLHAAADGLGVTEHAPGRFGITHLQSGMRLWPAFDSRDHDPAAILRAWHVARESGIDWTQDVEIIKAAHQHEVRGLYNRMRLAAFPPRRVSWYKGAQKRRMKPYEAQSKIATIRECVASGSDVMRSMWRDIWQYRRCGEMWGVVPAVIRQPCKRFGVTHAMREVNP